MCKIMISDPWEFWTLKPTSDSGSTCRRIHKLADEVDLPRQKWPLQRLHQLGCQLFRGTWGREFVAQQTTDQSTKDASNQKLPGLRMDFSVSQLSPTAAQGPGRSSDLPEPTSLAFASEP